MSKPRVFLPLRSMPICGHNPAPNLMGREEGMMVIHGKKAAYYTYYESGPCQKCDKEFKQAIANEVAKLERKKS